MKFAARRWLLGAWVASACGSGAERGGGDDIDVQVELPADDCWPGVSGLRCFDMPACVIGPTAADVQITSAADLDRLRDVRCIFGGLSIETADLVDLTGLEHIEVICQGITLRNNLMLTDTRGIQAQIGGGLSVFDNPVLERLEFLTLSAAGVRIAGNPVLERLSFPALVEGGLILQNNPALTDLSGLGALTHSTLHIERCAGLTTLGPLPSLETGAFVSVDNPLLAAIDAPKLRVMDYFYSTRDHALVTVRLPGLETADRIHVRDSAGFAALELPQLRELKSLSLTHNGAMTGFSALPALESLGFVELADNAALVDLAGLEALPGAIYTYIVHNAALDQSYAESVGAALGGSTKIAGNAGWVAPPVCPFEEDWTCDAIGCGGLELCAEGSDELDCCTCLGIECPPPPGGHW